MIAPATPAGDVRRALRDRAEIALLDVRQEGRFAAGHPAVRRLVPAGPAGGRGLRPAAPAARCRSSSMGTAGGRDDAAATAARGSDPRLQRRVGPGRRPGRLARQAASCSATSTRRARRSASWSRPAPARPASTAAGAQAAARGGQTSWCSTPAGSRSTSTMSIPTATSVPGRRTGAARRRAGPRPSHAVVVNCAGRTRSIIGTQSLINAGLRNPWWRCATARSAGPWPG